MRPLPVGTLTLLFSDIEGSTSMLTGLGPRWGEALSAHRTILRQAFAEHGGYEVGTEGDSFFVVFTSATQALLAAVAAQRELAEHAWPDGRSLRVRIGLHTGEPQVYDDDYIGMDVHRGARIAAAAHGGQTVMSEATHALVGEALRGMAVRDLGWYRLKDIPEPEHLYDVTPSGLSAEHPALRSLGTVASLPSYTTELIGRTRELGEVTAAMESQGARLVTITGSGGTGKTRLAVAAARKLQSRFPGGVFFVPLHTAYEPSRMWAAIAEAVDAPPKGEQLPQQVVLEFLRPQSALLVLDNVEQIADADVVVAALLDGALDVSLLVTSRRPLHLVEEHQYPLSTLAVPERVGEPAEVAQTPAVKLFELRTRMVRPDFAINSENVADVVALCRLLDGLPLAIELAAARSRLLGPRALLSRIDTWFGEALATPDRPERQRALTATIAWSYDLLSHDDQRVFRGLGVFSSGVGPDAVESVVGSAGRDPLNVLAHLVDLSLVEIVEAPDGEPMIYLLETVRRFARERLTEAGDTEETRLRHAEWCVRVAGEVRDLPHGPRQIAALDRMEAVIEDIRAALDWTLSATGPLAEERFAVGLTLLHSMLGYWYRFGHLGEGRVWHERALRVVDSKERDDSAAIVDALHGHGVVAVEQNDLGTGGQLLERALAMAHRLGDLDREARESNSLGIACREGGDVEGARRLIERSIEFARLAGSPQREATALCNMVYVHLDAGDYTRAAEAARTAVVADEALGDPWGVAIDQNNLVTALLHAEGPQPAYRHLVEIAPSAIALGAVDLSLDVVDSSPRSGRRWPMVNAPRRCSARPTRSVSRPGFPGEHPPGPSWTASWYRRDAPWTPSTGTARTHGAGHLPSRPQWPRARSRTVRRRTSPPFRRGREALRSRQPARPSEGHVRSRRTRWLHSTVGGPSPYDPLMSPGIAEPKQTVEEALAHTLAARPGAGSVLARPLEELGALDRAVYQAVAATSTPELDGHFRRLSRVADNSVLWLGIAAAIAVVGGRKGRRAAIEGVLAIGATSAAVNLGIKPLARRRRPDRADPARFEARVVPMPESTSFPSGHAASAFAFAYAVGRHLPGLAVPIRLLAGGVAYSRVHTGVHYPGDVVIGAILGAGIATMVGAACDRTLQSQGDV